LFTTPDLGAVWIGPAERRASCPSPCSNGMDNRTAGGGGGDGEAGETAERRSGGLGEDGGDGGAGGEGGRGGEGERAGACSKPDPPASRPPQ